MLVVLQAWSESSKQKKKHQEKNQGTQELPSPQEFPPSWEPDFDWPPILTFPWEEDEEEILETEQPPVVTLEDKEEKEEIREALPVLESNPEFSGTLAPREVEDYVPLEPRTASPNIIIPETKAQETVAAFKTGFPLEPEDVLRGYIWHEILQPPRAKRPFFPGDIIK